MLDQLLEDELLYLADRVNLPVYFLSVLIVRLTYWLVEGEVLLVESLTSSLLFDDEELEELDVLLLESQDPLLKLITVGILFE
jgi:hypothetical protein